jgi:hypothetical protein
MRVQAMAIKELLDRGWGRPAQTVTAKVEGVNLPEAHLDALRNLSGVGVTAAVAIAADDAEPVTH